MDGWGGKRKELGFVALDGVEEGVVVHGAGCGETAGEEIDVPSGGDDAILSGIVG